MPPAERLLTLLNREDYFFFVGHVRPVLEKARSEDKNSKPVLNVERKMYRFSSANSSQNGYGGHGYNAHSAHTPPPLVSDTTSLQTHSPVSFTDDAIAGASNSRQGSMPNSEQGRMA